MADNIFYSKFLLRAVDESQGYSPEDKELIIRSTPHGAQLVYKFNHQEHALEQDKDILMQDITYSDLITMIGASQLVPGKKYRLLDYQTIYNNAGNAKLSDEDFNMVGIGPKEVLILTAASNNKLCIEAVSESYPNDIIWYQYDDKESLVWNGWDNNDESDTVCKTRPGFITYRKDPIKNLSTCYDWRAVRWLTQGEIDGAYKERFAYTFDENSKNISVAKTSDGILLHGCTECEIKDHVHAVAMYKSSTNIIGPSVQNVIMHTNCERNAIRNSSSCTLYSNCRGNNLNFAFFCTLGQASSENIINTAMNLQLSALVAYICCRFYHVIGLHDSSNEIKNSVVDLTMEHISGESIDLAIVPEKYRADLSKHVAKTITQMKVERDTGDEPLVQPCFTIISRELSETIPSFKIIPLV